MYNPVVNKWSPTSRMNTASVGAATALNGMLYTIASDTQLMERYSPLTNSWDDVRPGNNRTTSSGIKYFYFSIKN